MLLIDVVLTTIPCVPHITALFAPTDTAFENLEVGVVEYLLRPKNRAALREVLSYHVSFVGELFYQDLANTTLTTLQGSDVDIVSRNGDDGLIVTVEDATIEEPNNVLAYNAIIHSIDTVLIPATVSIPPDIVNVLYESGVSPSLVGFLESV